MKKRYLGLLAMSTVLTLGLVAVNEHNSNVVDAAGTWNLVTDASTLVAGDQVVIAAADFDYAMSVTQNNNNRASIAITKSGETITIDANVQALTLEEGTSANSFAFNTGSGYLYAASTSSNHLKTKTTKDANGSFTISVSNGVATIKSVGNTSRGWMRYNSTNTPPLFSCYGSGQADIALYKFVGEGGYEVSTTEEIQTKLIKPYYNNGTYTKKSNINVMDTVDSFELASVFHKNPNSPVYKDRTTYYTPNALLMGDFDGTFENINSGYGNDSNDMYHYSYNFETEEIVKDYTVKNTSIQEFYVTLDKMLGEDYFEGWTFENNKATYGNGTDVLLGSDDFVKDFLAFTAPCLEPVILGSKYANYFQITKLEISKGEHVNWGEYLSLKMYVSSTNSGAVSSEDCVLSEARIYTGTQIIDEAANARIKINQVSGGVVESSLPEKTGNKVNYYKPDGTTITFTITPYENYELTGLTVTNNLVPVEIEFDASGCEFNVEMNGDVVVTPEFTKVASGDDSGDALSPLTEAKSLSFASKDQRTEYSTTRQVWTQNDVTLINDKASSSSNVGDYANPVRLYAGSSITIECAAGTFNKIVFDCANKNMTAWSASISTNGGVEVTVSGTTVTVTFTEAVSVFEIAKFTAQVQVKSLTVSYE